MIVLLKIFNISVFFFVGYITYNTMMEIFFGGGLGKFLIGLTVVDEHEKPATPLRIISRQAASALSWITLNLGHALALMRPDKKMLHDLVSKTEVIKGQGQWPWELSEDIHKGIKIAVLALMGVLSAALVYRAVQMGIYMGQQMQSQMGASSVF